MVLALGLVAQPGRAAPRSDPSARLAERLCRLDRLECVLGASDHGRLRQAEHLSTRPDDAPDDPRLAAVRADLAPELRVVEQGPSWSRPSWRIEPTGLLSGGDLPPVYRGGDEEPGWASARLGAEGRLYPGIFELTAAGRALLDLPGTPVFGVDAPEAWAGLASHGLVLGFGMRDRHLGPGHAGSLMLTDNAAPTPLGTLAWTSPTGMRLGRVHLEAGAGWIPGERRDVRNPGWLFMDLRWLLLPEVELGASRVGIFGGEGRPTPSLGQLLLPTDPHVYDDPDRLEPDQDERASLDLRLTFPVGRWAGIASTRRAVDGLDTVELWWLYGGEDVIARDLGGLPYPSLAGIGNLFGAEAVAGPLVLSVEHARLLDDYFRWYTGHRVYHDGFTRDGRSMALAEGGDSIGTWLAVAWEAGAYGMELSAHRALRVGVIEASGANLLALEVDERTHGVGLSGWTWSRWGWWSASLEVERVTGQDFVEGADGWAWRLAVGR
ncbi:capsule assembly Wzi family protein [Myxococcota bacterium]|nr:capsule assembly Wzi family protein [Myxococcota bacterium]